MGGSRFVTRWGGNRDSVVVWGYIYPGTPWRLSSGTFKRQNGDHVLSTYLAICGRDFCVSVPCVSDCTVLLVYSATERLSSRSNNGVRTGKSASNPAQEALHKVPGVVKGLRGNNQPQSWHSEYHRPSKPGSPPRAAQQANGLLLRTSVQLHLGRACLWRASGQAYPQCPERFLPATLAHSGRISRGQEQFARHDANAGSYFDNAGEESTKEHTLGNSEGIEEMGAGHSATSCLRAAPGETGPRLCRSVFLHPEGLARASGAR